MFNPGHTRTPVTLLTSITLTCIGGLLALNLSACRDQPIVVDEICRQVVLNPSFESITGITLSPGYEGQPMAGVEGWTQGPGAHTMNTPDIFDDPTDIPTNFMGSQRPLHGNNFAGISQGMFARIYFNESLMGTLLPFPGEGFRRTYTISAWFSTGSTRPQPSDVEFVLYNSVTGEERQVTEGRIPATMEWTQLRGTMTTTRPFDRIVIRGIDKSPNGHDMSYTYVDKVSIQECCRSRDEIEVGTSR